MSDQRFRGEAGMSMIELIVGMTLMTIFGSLFTAAVVLMNSSANKMESVSVTSSGLSTAFVNVDRVVRYASAVTTPARSTGTGDWYVEMQTTNTGVEVCTQLRVDITSKQLQQRRWTVTGTSPGSPAWTPLASNLVNGSAAVGSADQPFTAIAPAGAVQVQKLSVVLVARSGTSAVTTSRSAVTFAAANSATAGANSVVPCQQAGRP